MLRKCGSWRRNVIPNCAALMLVACVGALDYVPQLGKSRTTLIVPRHPNQIRSSRVEGWMDAKREVLAGLTRAPDFARFIANENAPPRWVSNEPKVFVVGMHKTGTSFWAKALKEMGLRTLHDFQWRAANPAVLRRYDAFTDGSLHDFRRLRVACPNSYVVLSTREDCDWIISDTAWILNKHAKAHQSTLRVFDALADALSRAAWGSGTSTAPAAMRRSLESKRAYERDVRAYFANDPRFIEVDVSDADKLSRVEHTLNRTATKLNSTTVINANQRVHRRDAMALVRRHIPECAQFLT